MARVVSLGAGLQDIYLIDHDDLGVTNVDGAKILGKISAGGKVDIDKIAYGVGGGGVNSSITFARHGHETILFSNFSHDPAGAAILRVLDKENVDTSYINFLERRATGTSVVLLDSKSGERTILTYRGASEQFGNLDEHDLDLIQPDWLYVTTLRGDMDTLERFFKYAKKLNIKIMFNPGVKELENQQKLLSLLKYIDILTVNKEEASKIVPGAVLTELFYRLNYIVDTVIVTDGIMGGILGNDKEAYRFGLYEDVKVKDVTGAGDAFGSGFLSEIMNGISLEKALTFASANATSVIKRIGASDGILTGEEELHLMPIQKI